jgi:hypothetical protein
MRKKHPTATKATKTRQERRLASYAGIMTSGKFAAVSRRTSCHAASHSVGSTAAPSVVSGRKQYREHPSAEDYNHAEKHAGAAHMLEQVTHHIELLQAAW